MEEPDVLGHPFGRVAGKKEPFAGYAEAVECGLSDTWDNGVLDDVPEPRNDHSYLWTGTHMLIWGGKASVSIRHRTGGVYDPLTDTWWPTTLDGAPSERYLHSAVWTGTKMIVWGGTEGNDVVFDDGAMYDPISDTWAPISSSGSYSPGPVEQALKDRIDERIRVIQV